MAEIVGFHVERMIPELEQMKRLKLFKQEEISEIIKKRKEFEYKIERTMKEKQDFLSYINYEVKLIREIKIRRDKLGVSEKKDQIEYAVTKRVTKLYKLALAYFKADVKLWMSYINFCTQTRFVNAVSEAFTQMLQVHGDKMYLWKFAAKWELNELDNIEGALSFLKTGIHHHPESRELYTEAFRLELMAGCENRNKKSIIPHAMTSDDETELKAKQEKAELRAEVHFRTSVKAIGDDVEYIISLLDIATEFEYTTKLQSEIIEYLTSNCWKHEIMWHTMAQRELRGHHYDSNAEKKSRIQLCIAVYKSAVKVLSTSAMWEKYLDTLIDLYLDKSKKNIKSVLEEALQEAYDLRFLLEKHYLIWIELLQDNPSRQLEIVVMATEAIATSTELWLTRLRHHIANDEEALVRSVSQEAMTALEKNALPIYRSLIQYYSLKASKLSDIKLIFEAGITKEADICLQLRPQYLDWLFLTKSLKTVRMEYERLAQMTPYCLALHKKMIELEKGRVAGGNPTVIRGVHKLACQQFGKDRTDVWMDYIKFEMKSGEARHVSDIYNNAKNTLDENLVSTFCTEFALLSTNSY